MPVVRQKRTGRTRCLQLLGCSALMSCLSTYALAADGGVAAPAANSGIQEVVVTAQKREQDVNKVPMSISVLSPTVLQETHIQDYQDITRSMPGISFSAGGSVSGSLIGPNTANIVIRGIGSSSGSATVALYLDDTSITQSNLFVGAEQPKFLDFDRIEVLRGPQGTLFGSSAMGGLLHLISKQPKLNVFSGEVDSDLSATEHGSLNYVEGAVLNIPVITDKLAIRVAAQVGENSGYIDHEPYPLPPQDIAFGADTQGLAAKKGTNTEAWDVFRFSAKYQANDRLSFLLTALWQRDHTNDTPLFYPDVGLFKQNKSIVEPSTDTLFIPSLTVDADFDSFTLKSVTSYFERGFKFTDDGTIFNSQAIAQFFLDPAYPDRQAQNDSLIGTLPSPVHRFDRTYQGSEEIRASSKAAALFGKPLDWIGGVYVEYQRQVRDDFEPSPGIRNAFQNIYGMSINDSVYGPAATGGFVSWDKDLDYSDNQSLNQVQYAAFGQADYHVLSKLTLTAGLRVLYATQQYYRNSGGILDYGNVNPFHSNISEHAVTPKFSANYQINETTSAYATIANGFRLGGPTGPVASSVCGGDLANIGITQSPTSFGPDHLWSYEAGFKSRPFDGRMSFNAAGYYIKWSNIQQTIALPSCGASVTLNFGAAETYGTEIEANAKLTDHLTASLVGGTTQAIITDSPNELAAARGSKVLNVPSWTLTAAADYRIPLGDKFVGFVRGDYDFIGPSRGAFNPTDPAFEQPAYDQVNASLGIEADRYKVFLYGKNLLNNTSIIQRPSINFVQQAYTLRPMTVGVTASYNF